MQLHCFKMQFCCMKMRFYCILSKCSCILTYAVVLYCWSIVSEPPSAVRNLSAVFVGHSMVNLSWNAPTDLGGRTDLRYRVECFGCGNRVSYVPAQTQLNSTRHATLLSVLAFY